MSDWFRWRGNTLLLKVHLQPRARRSEICGIQGDALKIRIHAPPVDGKANRELAALLAEVCHVNPASVRIVGGKTARHKHLTIALQEPILPEVLAKLSNPIQELGRN